MLQHAYINGYVSALARHGLKEAGLKEKLMPLMLAGGIGGGGTAAAAGAHHLMKHPPHMSASAPMPTQTSARSEIPNFSGSLNKELGRLDAAAAAR